jgi:hypothetical protein
LSSNEGKSDNITKSKPKGQVLFESMRTKENHILELQQKASPFKRGEAKNVPG